MRMRTPSAVFASSLGLLLVASGATRIAAQETQVGSLHGNAAAGKQDYRRYCVGCHGPAGDGNGENAQWIEPKPRDFTAAVFKCRSTPTGTLPTDEDLYHSVSRGFVTSNMPSWLPLTRQTRVDLVAYVKTFSPRWKAQGAGTPIAVPPETPATVESILHGRALFQKLECWKCHGPAGHGDGPSASTLTDSKDNPIRPYNFASGIALQVRHDQRGSLPHLHDRRGRHARCRPSPTTSSRQDAWDLVHFLRTLQPPPSPEATVWQAWLAQHAGELKPIGPDQSEP